MAAELHDLLPDATPATMREQAASEFFCSTPDCPFHVRVGDASVHGHGDWATLADGTTVSHRWIRDTLLCDLCAPRAIRRPT